MIVVVDYGAGNLASVAKAIVSLGYQVKVTSSPREVREASVVILPGVGAAGDAMANLNRLGLVEAIREVVAEDKPFFGVCLGFQLLFSFSEEWGRTECLNILPGVVRRLPPGLKIPHMGWNQVNLLAHQPLFEGIKSGTNFYFVHSYYADPVDRSLVIGETDYGLSFCSVVARGNLVATQFHPEKSGGIGLKLYDNFLRLSLKKVG
jgi:imidazole glycerol-phosphate synthase subunit HisH